MGLARKLWEVMWVIKAFKKFLRHLIGITKLDKENNQCIRQKKTGAQNIVKEIKQYQEK
jgi:hypothetical protein